MAEQSVSYQHATEDVSFSAVAPTDVSADNAAAAKPDLISDVDKQAEIRHGESQLDDDYDAAEDEGLDRVSSSRFYHFIGASSNTAAAINACIVTLWHSNYPRDKMACE